MSAIIRPDETPITRGSAAETLQLRRRVRTDFGAWCEYVLAQTGLKPAAHHRLMIRELQAVAEGRTQRLLVSLPPGAAKSTFTSDLFPAWLTGAYPGIDLICASNTASLAKSFSKRVMDRLREHGKTLGVGLATESVDLWQSTHGGRYRAVGVGGSLTGHRASILILDDPIKDRAQAESKLIRDKTFDWFTSVFTTRMRPGGSLIVVLTRWHEDDIAGRLLDRQKSDGWRYLCVPAIAQEDDPVGRAPGEYLWDDDGYGYGKLLRKFEKSYEESGAGRDWNALFQQDPKPGEGGLFKTAKIDVLDATPADCGQPVRAWDLAATKQVGTTDPDWTVGVRMARTETGRFIVQDVVRLRGGPHEVLEAIKNTASQDGYGVRIGLPQDPGQAGVAQATHMVSELAGYDVDTGRETGAKETRAAPFASQVNVGNVSLVRGDWNRLYLEEIGAFPSGSKDDQVDASSRAFQMLGGSNGADLLLMLGRQ